MSWWWIRLRSHGQGGGSNEGIISVKAPSLLTAAQKMVEEVERLNDHPEEVDDRFFQLKGAIYGPYNRKRKDYNYRSYIGGLYKRKIVAEGIGVVIDVPEEVLYWNNAIAVKIAREICESRQFSNLPILADALEDGGSQNQAILGHLRNPPRSHNCYCYFARLIVLAYNYYESQKNKQATT